MINNPISVVKSGTTSASLQQTALDQAFKLVQENMGILDNKSAILNGLINVSLKDAYWATESWYTDGTDLKERINDGSRIQLDKRTFYKQYFGYGSFGKGESYTQNDLDRLGNGSDGYRQSFIASIVTGIDCAYTRKMESIIMDTIVNNDYQVLAKYDPKNYTQGYILNGAGDYSATPADISIDCLNRIQYILSQRRINSMQNLGMGRKIIVCSGNTLNKILKLDQLKNKDYVDNAEQQRYRGLEINYQDMKIIGMSADIDNPLADNVMYGMLDNSIRAYASVPRVEYGKYEGATDSYSWYYNRDMGSGIELASSLIKININ